MIAPSVWPKLLRSLLAVTTSVACTSNSASDEDLSQPATLREAAARAGKFVGAAVRESALAQEATFQEVLAREFDSVTAENSMKWGPVAPSPTAYNWNRADSVVDFAEEHGLAVHGHTLVWDEQMPTWIRDEMTAEELRDAIRRHVETTMDRYRGRVRRWDVVNEAVDTTTESGYTESILLEKLGPEYIRDAFIWAHEADPEALLYYNEVGIERLGPKSDFAYAMIRDLVGDGVPIHGVGFQSHISAHRYPSESDLRENIRRFADLGLRVHISELDARTRRRPGDEESRLFAQRLAFQQVVGACMLEPGCEGVTFWGFTDKHSWIVDEQADEEPLLFDAEYAPKPAYQGAMDGLLGRVPSLGNNVVTNGDFSGGLDGWTVNTGDLELDEEGACHAGRVDETSSLSREPLLDVFSSGGSFALTSRVRLRGRDSGRVDAALTITSPGADPSDWNVGAIVANEDTWIELSGYFSVGFEDPPSSISLSFSSPLANVDVCVADVRVQPLAP